MSELDLTTFANSDAALTECARRITVPRTPALQDLIKLWHARPADGFEIGRDIPSRAFAPFLSHLLFWAPMVGGNDLVLRLCGEALRLRFGDDAIGKRFSEVIGADVAPYFLTEGKQHLTDESYVCFDMRLLRKEPIEGRSELHFELVIFPVWAQQRSERWILNALYYFL